LSAVTRRTLIAAALASAPTVKLVATAVRRSTSEVQRALEAAVSAGIVRVDGDVVRFTHPLYATGVQTMAPPHERRRMHHRLAALVDGVEERARHLAAATTTASEAVARTLEGAAEHARRRGAPEIAADMAERCLVLTPSQEVVPRRRRTIRAAEHQFHAGDLGQARARLERLLTERFRGRQRAAALRLLGEIHYHEDGYPHGMQLLLEALNYVGADDVTRPAIEMSLAYGAAMIGDFTTAGPHADRALAWAERSERPAILAEALAVSAMVRFLLGHGLDEAGLQRALALEDLHRPTPVQVRPSFVAGSLALYDGRLGRAHELLTQLRHHVLITGADSALEGVAHSLVWVASWRGDFAAAERYAREAIATAETLQADALRCSALAFGTLSAALRGDVVAAEARAAASRALVPATRSTAVWWIDWTLGLLPQSVGDPHTAHPRQAPLGAMFPDEIPEPARAWFVPDDIEARVAIGDLTGAERLLAAFTDAAERHRRQWALVLSSRCHAVLCAARGDLDMAAKVMDEAVRGADEIELRFEAARTFLAAGLLARRQRRKRAAVEHLHHALELFDCFGAELWSHRTRAELARVGVVRRRTDVLTPTERLVAELAATGHTNRAIAAQLFMSPKTVEANMSRVYRKIGVRSRAELGAWVATASPRAAK
jgi:DNA-binding NarL/FixJ family response regulator